MTWHGALSLSLKTLSWVAPICTFIFKTTQWNKPLNIISGTLRLRQSCSLCSIEMFTFALIDPLWSVCIPQLSVINPSTLMLTHSPLEHRPVHKLTYFRLQQKHKADSHLRRSNNIYKILFWKWGDFSIVCSQRTLSQVAQCPFNLCVLTYRANSPCALQSVTLPVLLCVQTSGQVQPVPTVFSGGVRLCFPVGPSGIPVV